MVTRPPSREMFSCRICGTESPHPPSGCCSRPRPKNGQVGLLGEPLMRSHARHRATISTIKCLRKSSVLRLGYDVCGLVGWLVGWLTGWLAMLIVVILCSLSCLPTLRTAFGANPSWAAPALTSCSRLGCARIILTFTIRYHGVGQRNYGVC